MANFLIAIDPNSISSGTVVLMGMGIVFLGLICLIFTCKIMGAIFGKVSQNVKEAPKTAPVSASAQTPIENKGEIVAAISAAVAESMGTDVSKIRIHSIKKI